MIGDFANSVTGRDLQDVRDDVGIAHRGMAAGTVAAIDGVAGAEVMGAMFSFSQGAWSVSPRAEPSLRVQAYPLGTVPPRRTR